MCTVEEAREVVVENTERKACIVRIKMTMIEDIQGITEVVNNFTWFKNSVVAFETCKQSLNECFFGRGIFYICIIENQSNCVSVFFDMSFVFIWGEVVSIVHFRKIMNTMKNCE